MPSDAATAAGLDIIRATDPAIASLIEEEGDRQEHTLELIASENHVSPAVMHAMGTCLTNKYAEGYPHHSAPATTVVASSTAKSSGLPSRTPCSNAPTPSHVRGHGFRGQATARTGATPTAGPRSVARTPGTGVVPEGP